MEGRDLFNEILKSPKLKEILGVSELDDIQEDFDVQSSNKEINVIRTIIECAVRKTSDESTFQTIKRIYDL